MRGRRDLQQTVADDRVTSRPGTSPSRSTGCTRVRPGTQRSRQPSGGACGPDLSGPGPFLVYATQEPGLLANLCGGTRAGPAPASLGAGQPPEADPVSPSTERRGPPAFTGRWVPLVGLFLAATAAAIVGLSLIRREPE